MAITINIEQTTIRSGKTATIDLYVDDKKVQIEVPVEVKSDFTNQFVRATPAALQKRRYGTLMALLRAAYKAGQKAGQSN